MQKRLIHSLLILLLITFGLVFVAPPWYHRDADLLCAGVFVVTLAVCLRVLIVTNRSTATDDQRGPGDRTLRIGVLIGGSLVCLVLFAIAVLTANRILTAAAIGPDPLRVVPAQVVTSAGTSRGGSSTYVTYQVAGHSYSFQLPAQDSGDTQAQAVLAVSRSDYGHATVYTDWQAGRARSAVTTCLAVTLAFIIAAVLTGELGLPRKRRKDAGAVSAGPRHATASGRGQS